MPKHDSPYTVSMTIYVFNIVQMPSSTFSWFHMRFMFQILIFYTQQSQKSIEKSQHFKYDFLSYVRNIFHHTVPKYGFSNTWCCFSHSLFASREIAVGTHLVNIYNIISLMHLWMISNHKPIPWSHRHTNRMEFVFVSIFLRAIFCLWLKRIHIPCTKVKA